MIAQAPTCRLMVGTGFRDPQAAQATLVGIELIRMLKKGHLVEEARTQGFTPAEPFSFLAA